MAEHPLHPHRRRLADWLTDHLDAPGGVEIIAFDEPKSGYSAETTMLTARLGAGRRTQRFVVRRETPEPPVYPVQVPGTATEIAVQYRVMEGLAGVCDAPLASLVGFEQDPDWLGAPFFVMEFIQGDVPVEDPIYTREGFFVDATAAQRRSMVDRGVHALAQVHRVDWQAAGLQWLSPEGSEPDLERQLRLWHDYTRAELDGRVHERLDRAWEYLWSQVPTTGPPCLNWGDPRLGNIIWRDFAPVCLTDFEAASIAPAEIDLGWWLMFDHWSHETMGVERLAGEPSREEQRQRYVAALGHDPGDTTYHEIFAAARYCGIVVRVMNRLVQRGLMPADHTIWLENPASDCLALLFP